MTKHEGFQHLVDYLEQAELLIYHQTSNPQKFYRSSDMPNFSYYVGFNNGYARAIDDIRQYFARALANYERIKNQEYDG